MQTLQDQGVQNNQQIMAIVMQMDEKEAAKENGVFDKLQEAKKDASKLLQKDSYMDVSSSKFSWTYANSWIVNNLCAWDGLKTNLR